MRASPIIGRAGAIDPVASQIIGRMTVRPNPARIELIETLVIGLRTSGLWDKLVLFYVFAAHDYQAATINWKSADYVDTPRGAAGPMPFTVDRGIRSDGARALQSSFKVGMAGTGPTELSLGAYLNVQPSSGTAGSHKQHAGSQQSAAGCGQAYLRYTGDYARMIQIGVHPNNIQVSASAQTLPERADGMFQASRVPGTPGTVRAFMRSEFVHELAGAGTGAINPVNTPEFVVANGNGIAGAVNYCVAETGTSGFQSMIYVGLSLTDAEMLTMNSLVVAYMTGVGITVY